MADAPSNFQTITNPVQATPHQRDHFLEVQHIVDIVLNRYGTEWYNLKMGLFIDLATFVSDHRNLFAINATLNQAKKTIPFVDYRVDPTIQRYLAFQTGERWRTVEGSVKELVNDMVNRQGAFPDLTRFVGNSVKTMFRW
ncbi:hypothetical protein H0H81_011273 [Sphagnurus paluster]|uniref:Uncharacterized protein n=1 Tax=Sphagnurus paluster TaxID=117069 RepID=A0A9P7GP63_9AGAR|nr:hypothetical protein H0H81_011273 [Sphagnurus paluster]